MYEKILVPLDGSDLAELAIRHAQEIARGARSEILLLQAVNFPYPVVPEAALMPDAKWLAGAKKEAARYLEGIAGAAARGGDARPHAAGRAAPRGRDPSRGRARGGRPDRHEHARARRAFPHVDGKRRGERVPRDAADGDAREARAAGRRDARRRGAVPPYPVATPHSGTAVAFVMVTGCKGTSWNMPAFPVGTARILSTTSIPSVTFPNTA